MHMMTLKDTTTARSRSDRAPVNGPKPLTMASMETAPASRRRRRRRRRRNASRPRRAAAAVRTAAAACAPGDPSGMTNTRTQMAAMVNASVCASAAALDGDRPLPAAQRVRRSARSAAPASTTAKVLVSVRTTTVSQNSLEMPNSAKAAAMTMLVTSRRQQAAEQHQREGGAHAVEAMWLGSDGGTAIAPSTANPTFAQYWIGDLRSTGSRAAARTGGTARWPAGTPTSARAGEHQRRHHDGIRRPQHRDRRGRECEHLADFGGDEIGRADGQRQRPGFN